MHQIAKEHLEPEAAAASAVQRSLDSAVKLQVQTDCGRSRTVQETDSRQN